MRRLAIIGVLGAMLIAVPLAGSHSVTLDFSDVPQPVNCNYPGCTHDHADLVIGNGFSNQFEGGPGQDELRGNGANDGLVGGGGADLLKGGMGQADALHGGAGDDVLDGGDGSLDFCDGGGGIDILRNCENTGQ